MLQIHPNARTTPAVRAEIARSGEATGVLARRFGVSTETVRKWRKRGPGHRQGQGACSLRVRGEGLDRHHECRGARWAIRGFSRTFRAVVVGRSEHIRGFRPPSKCSSCPSASCRSFHPG